MYIEYSTLFQDEIDGFPKKEDLDSKLQKAQPIKSEVLLPKINIPKFDGSYNAWRPFYDLFKSVVDKDPTLSNVQKLHYLKAYVSGEAQQLLHQVSTTEENYSHALELLKKRYNNKRVLVNTQLNTLFNQNQIKSESAQAIRQLLDKTDKSLHELKYLDIDVKSWDPVLLFTLVQKLPPETRQLWEQTQGSNTDLSTYSKFREFLESRFRTLEALDTYSSSSRGHTQKSNITHSFFNKIDQCIKCKPYHKIYNGPNFCKGPVQEKRKHHTLSYRNTQKVKDLDFLAKVNKKTSKSNSENSAHFDEEKQKEQPFKVTATNFFTQYLNTGQNIRLPHGANLIPNLCTTHESIPILKTANINWKAVENAKTTYRHQLPDGNKIKFVKKKNYTQVYLSQKHNIS